MIAPMTEADCPFVRSGWSSSYRMSRDATIPMELWSSSYYHAIVDWYVAKKNAVTLMSLGADVDARRGFICYEPGPRPMVHYLYVAEPYRGHGFARELFAATGIGGGFDYSHRTKTSWELLEVAKKAPLAKHNPIRARYAEEKT